MQGRLILTLMVAVLLAAKPTAAAVTYSLGNAQELLAPDFYAGQPEDGSDVAGRCVITPSVSPDGTKVAFLGLNLATYQSAVFVVKVGEPSNWHRVTPDANFPDFYANFTPDGSRLLYDERLYDVETGYSDLQALIICGQPISGETSMTRKASDNWLVTKFSTGPDTNQYIMLPILPNGEEDLSRASQLAVIADLPANDPALELDEANINSDGTMLAFTIYNDLPPGVPDEANVYVMTDLQAILAADKVTVGDPRISSAAITSIGDSRIYPIRTVETSNPALSAYLSEDNSLVTFGEDQNNVFNEDDFFNTLAAGNWDLFVSNADGTGSDTQFVQSGNQNGGGLFPGGIRMTYLSQFGGPLDIHLYATSLQIANPVGGTDLGNNDIQTTETLVSNDGSGTAVEIPTATVVNFPDGAPQEIQISTPIDPVTESQLPPGETVDAIPVVREFGPDGTTFDPPIEVTMSYTDAEIAGLDETTLTPYLFNEQTQVFDIPIPPEDIISSNPVTKAVKFRVSHFSIYGLGAQQITLSARSWEMYP